MKLELSPVLSMKSDEIQVIEIGVKPGEKIYEELISKADSLNTFNLEKYYSIVETNHNKTLLIYKKNRIKKVKPNFEYNSTNNDKFLNCKELKILINEYKNKNLKWSS